MTEQALPVYNEERIAKFSKFGEAEILYKAKCSLNPQSQDEVIVRDTNKYGRMLEKTRIIYLFGAYGLFKRFRIKGQTKSKSFLKAFGFMGIPLIITNIVISNLEIVSQDIIKRNALSNLSEEDYKEYIGIFKIMNHGIYIKL